MYGGILIVLAVALVALSPVIWGAWWFIADLGETIGGSARQSPYENAESQLRPAA